MQSDPALAWTDLFKEFAAVGRRLADIRAADGAAGNLSVYVADPPELPNGFSNGEVFALAAPAPELACGALVVTGSGRPLREIGADAEASLGIVRFNAGGDPATLHTSPRRRFDRLTVELNTHMAVHRDAVGARGLRRHAVIHAQPFHLTYLSHLPELADERALNQAILKWQPESIYHLREGISVVPFLVPASAELCKATEEAMRRSRLTLWSKHGVMARGDESLSHALELIEYAEVGARFVVLDRLLGNRAPGLTRDEIGAICAAFAIEQAVFA